MEEILKNNQTNIILCLLNKITDGGEITEDDVNDLRKHLLNEDGSYNVNREIADKLFELFNMAKNEQVVDNGFYRLFTDAICAHLLKDQSSTGVIDDREVDWLVGKIESNLEIDDKLFDLIQELKAKSYNKFPKKLDSAIILRRLRRIQRKLSESNNAGEELFMDIIKQLNECVKERDKLFIDDKCIVVLFGIKDQLSRKKLLQLPDDRNEQAEKKNTGESHTDEFIRVFCKLVSANVLYDENSPYDVDEPEANKLKEIINHKTNVDYIDKVLLDELESRSMYFPEVLAKVRFGYETASVRAKVVSALLEKLDEEKAKAALVEYINTSFECTNEQKLKAELLFDLKNLTKKTDFKEGTEEEDIEHYIQDIYVEQVTDYITGAESQSPYEIDETEEQWLEERLAVSESRYYQCDEALLKKLKDRSVYFPKSLEKRLSRAIMKRILLEVKGPKEMLSDKDLENLKKAIFDDNDEFKIDPKEAAEFIFKLKDIICKKKEEAEKKKEEKEKEEKEKEEKEKGKVIDKYLKDLFIKVVSKYLLEDKQSLGRVDPAEEEWLLAKIQSNGELDSYDEDLLDELEKKSINPPSLLHRTKRHIRKIGKILYEFRKISYIAVVSSLIASLVLFIIGFFHVVNAFPISFPDNVMVVDSALYNSIKRDVGISCDTVRFRKVCLHKGKDSYKYWNVRLMAGQGNENDMSGDINMGVHCTSKILGKKQTEGYCNVDRICVSGIRGSNGIPDLKSDAVFAVHSVFLTKRNWVIVDSEKNTTFVEIIEAVDTFLVALVVFILGIGIYELIIRKLEIPYKIREKRPLWMRISSVDDLKSSVVKVLLIAMIVGFYRKTLEPTPKEDLLYMAIGILIISAAFCLAEISAHYHHKSSSEDNRRNQDDNKKEEK